jgi:hypothetical protein
MSRILSAKVIIVDFGKSDRLVRSSHVAALLVQHCNIHDGLNLFLQSYEQIRFTIAKKMTCSRNREWLAGFSFFGDFLGQINLDQ